MLADDARWLRDRLTANGVPTEAIEKHLAVLGNKEAMEAALAWYRARGAIRGPLGPIRVPTLLSGATPTTPSAVSPPKARSISSPPPIVSKCCPASGILRRIRRRNVYASYCWNIWPRIRREERNVRKNVVMHKKGV